MLTREEIGSITWEDWTTVQVDALKRMALALLDVADLVPGAQTPDEIVRRLRGMDECFSVCQTALHAIQDLVPGEGDVVERVRRVIEDGTKALQTVSATLETRIAKLMALRDAARAVYNIFQDPRPWVALSAAIAAADEALK